MNKISLEILRDEYWWGGLVQDGIYMPVAKGTFSRDLNKEQLGNQSTPLLLSSKGRYLWSEAPFSYSFHKNELMVSGGEEAIKLSEGHKTLRGAFLHVLGKYFPADGIYPDPLMFTAPQYNTWIEMMYEPTQEKVLRYAKDIIDNGMPPGVLIIDDNWQEDYGVWSFHPGRFPEPKLMIDALHNMGFKVMLWVCNLVSADSLTGRYLEKEGYLVNTTEGNTAIAEWWNGYSEIIDFTNEKALNWFKYQLNRLIEEYGVDGFKFDAGDLDQFGDNFVCSKSINGLEYSELWAKIGCDYSLNEYRACWKMGGRGLAQRLSDKKHSWELDGGLGSLIPNGLTQGILGFAFTCPDMIGGGEYTNFLANSENLDMELIVRNAQCAALFPMMQFSVAPWRVLDETHRKLCVNMAKLHLSFGERILRLAKEAANTGEPIIRHMEYVFPGNGYEKVNTQFMLGDNILVAPVIEKGAVTKSVFFPEGIWKGDDGSQVEGPCIQLIEVPLSRLPWYEKEYYPLV